MLSVGLMVLAAAANATGSVLQRKAGRDEPDSESSSLRLIRDLAHRPVWFGGVAAIMVGFLLQAAALATGPIALVQPILVVALVFTLLLAAAVFRRPLHVREWGAVVGMTVGLALVLYALRPAGGDPHATPPLLWMIGSVATLVIVALFAAVGYRSLHTRRAAYLGLATGTGFGFTACLISAITAAYNAAGIVGVFTTWQTYLLIVIGPGFFFLLQQAMQAGRLVAPQPALTLSNPVVAFVFGFAVFGEHVRTGGWLAAAVVGTAMVVGATVVLVRSPLLHDHTDMHDHTATTDGSTEPAPAGKDGRWSSNRSS